MVTTLQSKSRVARDQRKRYSSRGDGKGMQSRKFFKKFGFHIFGKPTDISSRERYAICF